MSAACQAGRAAHCALGDVKPKTQASLTKAVEARRRPRIAPIGHRRAERDGGTPRADLQGGSKWSSSSRAEQVWRRRGRGARGAMEAGPQCSALALRHRPSTSSLLDRAAGDPATPATVVLVADGAHLAGAVMSRLVATLAWRDASSGLSTKTSTARSGSMWFWLMNAITSRSSSRSTIPTSSSRMAVW
jgi:hypothetical protein